MKKIFPIFCTLLLAGGSPLWAAYAKIGDYRDVEVVNVTWRGIEVLHRDGGCILTEKDLSDADKATLKKELEQHRQLLKEQQARWEERRKELEKEKKIADQQARSVNNVMNQAKKNKNLAARLKTLEDAKRKFPKAANMQALNKLISDTRKAKKAADDKARKAREAAAKKKAEEEKKKRGQQ